MHIQVVGVIGAGVMGSGVAQNLVLTGHRLILLDLTEKILARAREEITRGLRLQKLFGKTAIPGGIDAALQRITFTTDWTVLKDADFVIESVTEKWEIKKSVYTRMDIICPKHCIFASNTSAIPITRIGLITSRPAKVIGMHFMNPAPMKPLVEVIRSDDTAEETLQAALDMLTAMGKEYVIVKDSPGFVSNRVLMVTINEAIFLLQDQIASAEDVDKIFRMCFSHKMGPLETADLIGLDTIFYSLEVLYDCFHQDKYKPCPLLKQMVDEGLSGRKSGRGFYNYT
jgi:3-hydroxybutyryl-CoA dehydrogenase